MVTWTPGPKTVLTIQEDGDYVEEIDGNGDADDD